MQIIPSFSQFSRLAQQGNLVPVYTDLMADCITPVVAYVKLRQQLPAFLFESIEGGEKIGRYSLVSFHPRKQLKVFFEKTEIVTQEGVEVVPTPKDPLSLLEAEMAAYRPVALPNMPPFTGGAVGFISYEYAHYIEPTVPIAPEDDLHVPLLYFMLTDSVIIFDHVKQTLRLCANAFIKGDPEAAYKAAVTEIENLMYRLQQPPLPATHPLPASLPLSIPSGNMTQAVFQRHVEQAKGYIYSGDIIQMVLSQRFQKPFDRPPLELYRALRLINPSPYMFLLETGTQAIVGASPEVQVRLTGKRVEIRPIAGTRQRGCDDAEDQALEKALLADEKERAEHLMLVDLARNDIGRVCQPGSIQVPHYMTVERYSHVMHLVSQVEGMIQADKNASDLMRATFPAGTVSGAPKVRAMQIIAAFEGRKRGLYAGTLGYFSYHGNLDACITIRTALIQNHKLYLQCGAGIVADSIPEAEYEETLNKAKGLLKAIALVEALP